MVSTILASAGFEDDVGLVREGHVVISAVVATPLGLEMQLKANMLTEPARVPCVAVGLASRQAISYYFYQTVFQSSLCHHTSVLPRLARP
jgi:hypothetical protein